MVMEQILKYFKGLTKKQVEQLEALQDLYAYWNAQINVISRRDMEHFYERHVLHSLAIAKVYPFKPGQIVLDIGTGGGFPGIPLAILYPETEFLLVDSIAKKIKVVQEVTSALSLKNVSAQQARAEKVKGQFDFVVSRAVTQMPRFLSWTRGKLKKSDGKPTRLTKGILYLKGGDLSQELEGIDNKSFALSQIYNEAFFETKMVIYVSS
jgi:16S rRNA (guanine527-N7)-methyltransferase